MCGWEWQRVGETERCCARGVVAWNDRGFEITLGSRSADIGEICKRWSHCGYCRHCRGGVGGEAATCARRSAGRGGQRQAVATLARGCVSKYKPNNGNRAQPSTLGLRFNIENRTTVIPHNQLQPPSPPQQSAAASPLPSQNSPRHRQKCSRCFTKLAISAAARQVHNFCLEGFSRFQTCNTPQKMSSRTSGGGVKRQREEVEEEDAPASMQVAAHAEPLVVLAVVKSNFGALVCAQVCNPQGVFLFSHIRLPPRVSRPFAGAPVYDMSLTHAERLCAVGCGFKGRLVRLLSLGVGRYFEPQRNMRACHQMMQSNARRVASKSMAAVRDKAAKEAEELCASGQCAAAVVPLQRAIHLGDLSSLALKAWLHIHGREGVAKDRKTAFELAEEGARLGCHHCQGVLASCYSGNGEACELLLGQLCGGGYGCTQDMPRSLELARESSGRGSRYGQLTLGRLHWRGHGRLAQNRAQAVAFFRLAAAQGLDEAQFELGRVYNNGFGVASEEAEALRWFHLAAAQGHPEALSRVAACHEKGLGVAADAAEAICWHRRAHVAGCELAAEDIERLMNDDDDSDYDDRCRMQ